MEDRELPFSAKCATCGKPKGEHKADTFNCPGGRKSRVHGYPWFHAAETFRAKPGKVAKVRFRGASRSDDIMDFTVFLDSEPVRAAAAIGGEKP